MSFMYWTSHKIADWFDRDQRIFFSIILKLTEFKSISCLSIYSNEMNENGILDWIDLILNRFSIEVVLVSIRLLSHRYSNSNNNRKGKRFVQWEKYSSSGNQNQLDWLKNNDERIVWTSLHVISFGFFVYLSPPLCTVLSICNAYMLLYYLCATWMRSI